MAKEPLQSIACCGQTLQNNKYARHKHRKAMAAAGIACSMQLQTVGRRRLCNTPEKRAKRREAHAKKKKAEMKARQALKDDLESEAKNRQKWQKLQTTKQSNMQTKRADL